MTRKDINAQKGTKGFITTEPKKPVVPTASQVDNETYPMTQHMTPVLINATYEKYLMKKDDVEALAESRRDEVERVLREQAERQREEDRLHDAFRIIKQKNLIVRNYVDQLFDDPFTRGFSRSHIENIVKQALILSSLDVINEDSDPVKTRENFTTLIIDMVQGNADVGTLPLTEDEIRFNALTNLESHGVEFGEIDILIDIDKITEATRIFEEAKANWKQGLSIGASSSTDFNQFKQQALDGFILLGFPVDEAKEKMRCFFNSIYVEPPF